MSLARLHTRKLPGVGPYSVVVLSRWDIFDDESLHWLDRKSRSTAVPPPYLVACYALDGRQRPSRHLCVET
jgi:hypothetical protein